MALDKSSIFCYIIRVGFDFALNFCKIVSGEV